MSQQDIPGVSTEQWSRPAQPANDRKLHSIRSGIYLIAWFIVFDVLYSLTRSVISILDTDFNLDDSARFFIGVGVAALLAFVIVSAARGADD